MNCVPSAIALRPGPGVAFGRTLGLCTTAPPRSGFARKLPFCHGEDLVATMPPKTAMGIHTPPSSSSSSSVWADAGAHIRPTASNVVIKRRTLLLMTDRPRKTMPACGWGLDFGSIRILLASCRCSAAQPLGRGRARRGSRRTQIWTGVQTECTLRMVTVRVALRRVGRRAWQHAAERLLNAAERNGRVVKRSPQRKLEFAARSRARSRGRTARQPR